MGLRICIYYKDSEDMDVDYDCPNTYKAARRTALSRYRKGMYDRMDGTVYNMTIKNDDLDDVWEIDLETGTEMDWTEWNKTIKSGENGDVRE